MVLESAMLCVDNSEYMRNGDFTPTRLQCQQDAANMIVQAKLRSNPENAVGLLSMSSEVEFHSSMTQEQPRLFMKLHQIQPKGLCNFVAGIKTAHLALKHRQNRSHRVVLFVGSPMGKVDPAELIKAAKKFKKEKVECHVICFGEADSDNSKLMGEEGTGSSLVVVPAGTPLTEPPDSSSTLASFASEAVVPEVQSESMDVDVTTNDDNVDDLANNPDLLQQIVNDLPTEIKKKDDSK